VEYLKSGIQTLTFWEERFNGMYESKKYKDHYLIKLKF
jgi:hypothetical protein